MEPWEVWDVIRKAMTDAMNTGAYENNYIWIEVMLDPNGNRELAETLAPLYRERLDTDDATLEFEWMLMNSMIKGEA